MLAAQAQNWVFALASAAPTPGEELPFNPDDVTPGPLGFFVFIFVAVATGLLVMDLIRRTSRVQARARIREQLQAEIAASEATSGGTEPVAGAEAKPQDGTSTGVESAGDDVTPSQEHAPDKA